MESVMGCCECNERRRIDKAGEEKVDENGEQYGGGREAGGETLIKGEQKMKKEDAILWVECRGGVGANGREGVEEQVWGAEIYVWRELQQGSRGKQPGLL